MTTQQLEKLVEQLGVKQLSTSQVSEMAGELDGQVAAFRNRPLDGGRAATEHLQAAREELLAFTAFRGRSGSRSGRTTRRNSWTGMREARCPSRIAEPTPDTTTSHNRIAPAPGSSQTPWARRSPPDDYSNTQP
jgi:hypothetical protein